MKPYDLLTLPLADFCIYYEGKERAVDKAHSLDMRIAQMTGAIACSGKLPSNEMKRGYWAIMGYNDLSTKTEVEMALKVSPDAFFVMDRKRVEKQIEEQNDAKYS